MTMSARAQKMEKRSRRLSRVQGSGIITYYHSKECEEVSGCRCGQTCRGGFGIAHAQRMEQARQLLKTLPTMTKKEAKEGSHFKDLNLDWEDLRMLWAMQAHGVKPKHENGTRYTTVQCQEVRDALRADMSLNPALLAAQVGLSRMRVYQIRTEVRIELERQQKEQGGMEGQPAGPV